MSRLSQPTVCPPALPRDDDECPSRSWSRWSFDRVARLGFLVGQGFSAEQVAADPIIGSTARNVHRQVLRFGLAFREAASWRLPGDVADRYDAAARKRGLSRDGPRPRPAARGRLGRRPHRQYPRRWSVIMMLGIDAEAFESLDDAIHDETAGDRRAAAPLDAGPCRPAPCRGLPDPRPDAPRQGAAPCGQPLAGASARMGRPAGAGRAARRRTPRSATREAQCAGLPPGRRGHRQDGCRAGTGCATSARSIPTWRC